MPAITTHHDLSGPNHNDAQENTPGEIWQGLNPAASANGKNFFFGSREHARVAVALWSLIWTPTSESLRARLTWHYSKPKKVLVEIAPLTIITTPMTSGVYFTDEMNALIESCALNGEQPMIMHEFKGDGSPMWLYSSHLALTWIL